LPFGLIVCVPINVRPHNPHFAIPRSRRSTCRDWVCENEKDFSHLMGK
jgi:hypothetical protein